MMTRSDQSDHATVPRLRDTAKFPAGPICLFRDTFDSKLFHYAGPKKTSRRVETAYA
jgi:hypothetical protein